MSASQDDYVQGHKVTKAESLPQNRPKGSKGFLRATEATKKLLGVVGMSEPLPFVTPPTMPYTLEQEFEIGLAEYGLKASVPAAHEQQRLLDIMEESESELLALYASDTDIKQKEDSMSPVNNIGQQAAPSIFQEQGASCDTESDEPNEGFDDSSGTFHSTTTLTGGAEPSGNDKGKFRKQATKIFKPFFPSPSFDTPTLKPTGKTQGGAPADEASGISHLAEHNFWSTLFKDQHKNKTPQSKAASPLPKIPKSKKRAQSPSGHNSSGPAPKEPRVQGETGLPIIPAESLYVWAQRFPGNTPGLLAILSKWSVIMMEFRDRLSHPQSFAAHPAFPFRITHPTRQRVISVSFYDISTNPHKEIRFLGPSDATEIVYAEVDVFRSKYDSAKFQTHEDAEFVSTVIRENLGITEELKKGTRYMDQTNHAMTGEGRWAFVIIKDLKSLKSGDSSPPFVMLAWQISAVTSTSACLHTIFPDDAPTKLPPIRPQPVGGSLRRLVSLSNLMNPKQQEDRLYKAIHSESTSELPQVDVASIQPPAGAQTLLRTVIKFEKAGKIPLVEGYRVDITKFREWMDAVARGKGKVMLWTERT